MKKNHYQIFGVPNDATAETIRTLHREKRQQFASHPEIARVLDEAAQVLTDPESRRAYDRELAASSRHQVAAPPELKNGLRPVHFIFAGLLGAGAYGWQNSGHETAMPSAVPQTVVSPQSDQRDLVDDRGGEGEEAITSLTPLPPTPVATANAAVEAERPRLVRAAKMSGFDPYYLAWSVYDIVGAKGRGTGVMLERDKIVTNCHVIAGSYRPHSIVAINSATKERFYPEKLAILSESEDVCVLQVPNAPEYIAQWGSSTSLAIGTPTYTVSLPGNDGLTSSRGNLLGRESISGLNVLLTSNHCRPGVSGGPLFDGEGNVIGITSATRRERTASGEIIHGACISIEAETAKEVMWRTPVSLAIAPIQYKGVWNANR